MTAGSHNNLTTTEVTRRERPTTSRHHPLALLTLPSGGLPAIPSTWAPPITAVRRGAALPRNCRPIPPSSAPRRTVVIARAWSSGWLVVRNEPAGRTAPLAILETCPSGEDISSCSRLFGPAGHRPPAARGPALAPHAPRLAWAARMRPGSEARRAALNKRRNSEHTRQAGG